jgi:TonB family protein
MLDQLVESRDVSSENKRKNTFIAGALLVIVTALVSTLIYSLLNYQGFGTVGATSELAQLLEKVEIAEEAPPPEPETKPEKTPPTDKIVVKELVASLDRTTEPPKDTRGRRDVVPPPPDTNFDRVVVDPNAGRNLSTSDFSGLRRPGGGGGGVGTGDLDDAPPPPRPTPPKIISGGVVNGKAINLVKPPYPPAARAVRAAGAVDVQVVIDEQGNVTSATATSGNPLLRPAAVQAARQSKFSPTMLSGQAVKVSGIIRYNFVP